MSKIEIAKKVAPFVGATLVLGGAWLWFGTEHFLAVCVVAIVCFLLGCWLGFSKSESVLKRKG